MLIADDSPLPLPLLGLGAARRITRPVRTRKQRPQSRLKRGVASRGDDKPKIDEAFVKGAVNDLEKLRILAELAKAARLDNSEGISEGLDSGPATKMNESEWTGEMNARQYEAFKRANQFINDFIFKGMELQKIKGLESSQMSPELQEKKGRTTADITQNVMSSMSGRLAGKRYIHAKQVADLIIAEYDKANSQIQGGLNQGLTLLNKKLSQGANEAVATLTSTIANVGGAIEGINAATVSSYQAVMSSINGFGRVVFPGDEPKAFFSYANSLSVIPPNMDVNNPNDVMKYGSVSIAILAFPYLIDALDANAEKLLSKIQDKDVKKIANLYIKSLANAIAADRTGDVGGILARRAKALDAELNQTLGKKAAESYTNSIKRDIQNIKFARSQSEIDEYMTNINALLFQMKQSGAEVPGNLVDQANEAVRLQKDRISKQEATGPSWKNETDPELRQRKMELASLLTSINSDLIALESRAQTYRNYGGAAPDLSMIQRKIQDANKIAEKIGRGIDQFDKSSLAEVKRRLSNVSNIVSSTTPIGGGGPGVSYGSGNQQPQNPYNYYPSSGGEMGPFQQTQPPTQPNYTIAGLGDLKSVPVWLKVAAAVVGSWFLLKALK